MFLGCVCFVPLSSSDCNAPTSQAVLCIFVEYSSIRKGFLCYDSKLKFSRMSINVVLREHAHYYASIDNSTKAFARILNDWMSKTS